jgi:outer membrane protein OmpA-like peptidoglycan-associated protein
MKSSTVFVASFLLLSLISRVSAQHATELSAGYYIVVGAYAPSRENVAQNYTEVLTRRGFNAAYGFNTEKKFFYVYIRYFNNLRESISDMQNTRKDPEFSDAWVRVIAGEIPVAKTTPEKTEQPKTETTTSRTVKSHKAPELAKEQPAARKEHTAVAIPEKNDPPVPAENKTGEVVQPETLAADTKPKSKEDQSMVFSPARPDIVVTDNPPIKQFPKVTLANTEVFLSLFNSTNNRIVEGTVTVIEPETEKPLKQVTGNEYLNLPNPRNKSGKLLMSCEAFGYRKIVHEINYNLPLADTVRDYIDLMGTTFVVNFDLVRYHKGDMATLFHVYFYNDAAVMLPESKTELNNLLQLLQENEHYRIMLHGHTNGNYHGKIITLGPDKNFFSIEGSTNTMGTAKDLSYDRAETIKEYLEANGIDSNRIELKAWGGKRPLYDKHSVNAKKNVRVEVEILDE